MRIVLPSSRTETVGDGAGPAVAVRLADQKALLQLLRDPDLAFGELFMDGRMQVLEGSIYDVLAIAAQSVRNVEAAAWILALRRLRNAAWKLFPGNPKAKAKANVAHHYDLDFRLYRTFLDEDFQYSCGYFENAGQSLDDAQLAKKRHLAAKLRVEPGMNILDIGCGWGGLALYLAEIGGGHVTGITLSQEQYARAQQRAVERGRSNDAIFRLEDYRDVEGPFDRIVSVGMFEHVGVGHYDTFFRKCAKILDKDGVFLLHTIGRSGPPSITNAWIAKYIFPGGYIPALSEVLPAIQRSQLVVTDVEILQLHYAETLRAWRERFLAHREEVERLYDARFVRMWEFYLASSEMAFRESDMVVFQIQMAKRKGAVPQTRDYIGREETRLRGLETTSSSPLRLAGE